MANRHIFGNDEQFYQHRINVGLQNPFVRRPWYQLVANKIEQKVLENPEAAAKTVASAAAYGVTSASVSAAGAVKKGANTLTSIWKKRKHPGEDKPIPPPKKSKSSASQSNNPSRSNTATSMSSSNITTKQDDVPIKPFGRVSKTAPDYFTVRLPYAESNRVVANTNEQIYKELQFRLNSIFDVSHASGGQQQPQGRDKWISIFDYYRVLKCDVKMTIINNNARDDQYSRMLVGYQWGEEPVTEFAKTIPTQLAAKRSHMQVLLGRNCDHHGNATVLQYTYDEKSFEHHVNPTDQDTIWTSVGFNPDVKRNIIFTVTPLQKGSGPTEQSGQIDFQYILEAQYTVQFREAKHDIIRGEMQGTVEDQTVNAPDPVPQP